MKDKKILRYIVLFGIIAAVLIFAGCELASSPEFVGTWLQDLGIAQEELTISETSIVVEDSGLFVGKLTLSIVSYDEDANHIHAQIVSGTGIFSDPVN